MIKDNIVQLRQRIALACAKAGRKPEEITLVAVAKGRSPQEIEEAISAGITDIGENRVQEAIAKYNDMRYAICDMPRNWHMVGHLQTNKVKDAVRIFDLIHSVDSLRLAEEIGRQAVKADKIQDILLEVKTSPETAKFGMAPEQTAAVVKEIARLQSIRILGLMTIAPAVKAPEQARPYFRQLRQLLERMNAGRRTQDAGRILSMGMTDDFEAAIEEGATMLRIGRAIFEQG